MQNNSDLLLRINRGLSLIVGLLVIGAIGFACCEYGPGVAASVHEFYHPPDQAQRVAENYKAMMQHVKNPTFETNDEFRKRFEAQQAEFERARRIGENYRMPPRRP